MSIKRKNWKRITAIVVIIALLFSMKFGNLTEQFGSMNVSKRAKAAEEKTKITGNDVFQYMWIESNATSIKKGDVIEIGLYMRNICMSVLNGHISFDKDIFEEDFDVTINPQFERSLFATYTCSTARFIVETSGTTNGKYFSEKTLIATFSLTAKKNSDESSIFLNYISTADCAYTKACTHGSVELYYPIGENIGYECKIPGSSSDTNIGTNTPISHLYTDYNYTTPVTDNSIIIYANGSTITIDNQKTNYRQATLYTDILASYLYSTDKKGNLKTATGKVIAGITTSSAKPELIKGKIVDKEAAKIATASIKNGKITVTAKSRPGIAYLWIMDTGKQGTYTCCPIRVKAAPTSLNLYAVSNSDSSFEYGKTKKYTKDTLVVSNSTNVYLYPTYKGSSSTVRTSDATYSAFVDSKSADYYSVSQSTTNPYCFKITAKALKDNKTTTGKITIKCNQNGKKVTFTVKTVIKK